METFEDMFDLKAMQEISIILEHNSKALQSSSLTTEEAVTSIAKVKAHYKGLRSEEQFNKACQWDLQVHRPCFDR